MDRLGRNDIEVKKKSFTSERFLEMETKQVAERFKQIRFNLQKSQMELASMLNVDQKRISRTEQGLQDLNGEFLTSMRKVLGLKINWLLFGESEMFAETTSSNIETMPVYRMWTKPGTIWTHENAEQEKNPLVFDKSIFFQSFRVEDEDTYRFGAFRMRGNTEDCHINNNELFIVRFQEEGDQTYYGWACYIYQWHEAIVVGYLKRANDKELVHYYRPHHGDFKPTYTIPIDKNFNLIGRVRIVMSQH